LAFNTYEGMFILDSNRYNRDPAAVSGQVNDIIKRNGGEILVSRLWEERRLAYPIDGHRKGSYWLAYFRMDSKHVSQVQRECQLSDPILRALILKVEPRIADALVAHARASTTAGTKESAPKEHAPKEMAAEPHAAPPGARSAAAAET
jgi:small subunit ribosomal protein S6